MRRHILIVTIGYIIGILWGIYFNLNIFSFCVLLILGFYLIRFFKSQNRKLRVLSAFRFFKYALFLVNGKVIILACVAAVVSNFIVLNKINKFEDVNEALKSKSEMCVVATVVSDKMEKQYKNCFEVMVESIDGSDKYKGVRLILNVKKSKSESEFDRFGVKYGDRIQFFCNYEEPVEATNYKGFDYKKYLQVRNIIGIANFSKSLKVMNEECLPKIFMVSNSVKNGIKENFEKVLEKGVSEIAVGILLGDTDGIADEVQQVYRGASIAHVLAVSGLHIIYIGLIIEKIIDGIEENVNLKRFVLIGVLFFLMFLTDFSASVVRAVGMQILALVAELIHRRNDSYTSLAIVLLALLFFNPFLIKDIGLVFSFLGTLGIFVFHRDIAVFVNKKRFFDRDKLELNLVNRAFLYLLNRVKGTVSLSLSVQIMIIPFYVLFFNTVSLTFLIGNIFVGLIMGPIMILCLLVALVSFVWIDLARFFGVFLGVLIKLLNFIADFSSKLPFSKVYIRTPSWIFIFLYYVIIFGVYILYLFFKNRKNTVGYFRVKNIFNQKKFELKKRKREILVIGIIFCVVFCVLSNLPKDLRIYFIDVDQGDSTLIRTANNRTILIDGGGSEFNEEFDVGRKILLPYLLNRGVMKIDFVLVSHFDMDHVGGVLTVLEELDVKNVLISKQYEESENYDKFRELVRSKRINVITVKKGDRIKVDEDTFIEIMHPDEGNVLKDNVLNNNSVVCKLVYKDFSMLFTGDIEKVAEEVLVSEYGDTNKLEADVLKVAHHGSKSSSIQSFLKLVRPRFALIGVGENNLYGHPSLEVLDRFEELKCKVFRTDVDGEIRINVDSGGKIKNIFGEIKNF